MISSQNFFKFLSKAETLFNKVKEISTDVQEKNYLEALKDLGELFQEAVTIYAEPLTVSAAADDIQANREVEEKYSDLASSVPTIAQNLRTQAVKVRSAAETGDQPNAKFGVTEVVLIAQMVEAVMLVISNIRKRLQGQ